MPYPVEKFTTANDAYLASGKHVKMPFPPPEVAAKIQACMVVTCLDPRLEQLRNSLDPEDTHGMIRNAGGSARDALRSIIILQKIGFGRDIAIIKHSDCGARTIDETELKESVKAAGRPGAEVVDHIHFHAFKDATTAVKENVTYLLDSPLLIKDTKVTGWVFDDATGKLSHVV